MWNSWDFLMGMFVSLLQVLITFEVLLAMWVILVYTSYKIIYNITNLIFLCVLKLESAFLIYAAS
jgi:hypothetical protein